MRDVPTRSASLIRATARAALACVSASLILVLATQLFASIVFPVATNGEHSHDLLLSILSTNNDTKDSGNDKESLSDLPDWVTNYFQWHKAMRAKFPGDKLWSDPEAPKLLIRTCTIKCGGLHDRLGKLPWDLYLANQTNRVLLMNWCDPPLETFLAPNELDWTVPRALNKFHNASTCPIAVRDTPELFKGGREARGTEKFWRDDFEVGLREAKSGSTNDEKILRHQILGGEHRLKELLVALGETDTIDWTPSFGRIFWLFFKPTPHLQREIETVNQQLNLSPGKYTAVHCRVRHPKALVPGVEAKVKLPGGVDRNGLRWVGESIDYAVETAVHAIQCGHRFRETPDERIYFYADSEDLVRYMTSELSNTTFVTGNASLFESNDVHAVALQVAKTTRLIGRDVTMENLHIDRQRGHEPAAYFGTFIDLFIGVNARCITLGVGNYALFALKISGSLCRQKYKEETWGGDGDNGHIERCPLNMTHHFDTT